MLMTRRFLPWTIDFKRTPAADKRNEENARAAFDGFPPIIGRFSDMNHTPINPPNPSITSEAHDVLFKGYVPGQSYETWIEPDLEGFRHSQRHEVSWGRSLIYNQPRSTATEVPCAPIVTISNPQIEGPISLGLDGISNASHIGDRNNTWSPGSSDDEWTGPDRRPIFRMGPTRGINLHQSTTTGLPQSPMFGVPRQASQSDLDLHTQDGSLHAATLEEQENDWGLLSTAEWEIKASEQGNGGLHNAIRVAIRESAIKKMYWVGTLGMPIDSLTEPTRSHITRQLETTRDCLTVFVDDSEFVGYYNQFCRSILWPILHYQMQEGPRHVEYEEFAWEQYIKVNEEFADIIIRNYKEGDKIWVFDYHLLLLPEMLRSRLPGANIGFFLTTPFPSYEVFRCLFSRNDLLTGMLGADLVSFQTEEYCAHFVQCCCRLLGLEMVKSGLQVRHRRVSLWHEPMQIDAAYLQHVRQTHEVKAWMTTINNAYPGKRLITARDRMDVPGAVKHSLLAFYELLKTYPRWRGIVTLVQVISAAPETRDVVDEIVNIATMINVSYASVYYDPLVLVLQDMKYSQFIALLSLTDIFVSMSQREGMNLTCHEYFHCQGRSHFGSSFGSIIVSEFAETGALKASFTCNPWDYKNCSKTINQALEEPLKSRRKRWHQQKNTMEYMRHGWMDWLQSRLRIACKTRYPPQSDAYPLIFRAVAHLSNCASSRLFLLEDGCLFGEGPGDMSLDTLKSIETLAMNPSNIVYITSRRSRIQMQHVIDTLPVNVGYIFECGCQIKLSCESQFRFFQDRNTHGWLNGIWHIMRLYEDRVGGDCIERRDCSMVFHYGAADDYPAALRFGNELAFLARALRGNESYKIIHKNASIHAEPDMNISMESGIEFVMSTIPKPQHPEFVFVVGGVCGTNALFRWANRKQCDIKTPPHHATKGSRSPAAPFSYVYTVGMGLYVEDARFKLPMDRSLMNILETLASAPHASAPPVRGST
ncbi:uncharacterized protein N7511_010290 [Penicillium nucicola]|uniref:uncharacterized protein n=1 Tax=Penicillium nucicola TaxID=1850975 RepID=UPI002544E931|nr:uncharacterized protein N7511_010290 [Penicillium nucicola]KAJ5748594.1 hypothetical protein N7511_010290 [Penicillium nucicola]